MAYRTSLPLHETEDDKPKSNQVKHKKTTPTSKHKVTQRFGTVTAKHKGKGYVPSFYTGGEGKTTTKGTVTKTKYKAKDMLNSIMLKEGAKPKKTTTRKATRKKYQ